MILKEHADFIDLKRTGASGVTQTSLFCDLFNIMTSVFSGAKLLHCDTHMEKYSLIENKQKHRENKLKFI